MSGGHFDYKNDTACYEIFSWDVRPTYGIGGKDQKYYAKIARQLDPMEDIELSDMVYDMFCLLHSLDWYQSGDTSYGQYQADVDAFKRKWFKGKRSDRLKEYVDVAVADLRDKLLAMIGELEKSDG